MYKRAWIYFKNEVGSQNAILHLSALVDIVMKSSTILQALALLNEGHAETQQEKKLDKRPLTCFHSTPYMAARTS